MIKKLFVGNIDKSIPFDEIKFFFYSKFSSIINAKLIIDQQTGRSKGYAFFEFSNYKEFRDALNLKEPLIFGKQKLVLNSAKNKYYDNDQDVKIQLGNSSSNLIKEQSLDSLNLFSQNTGVSPIRNSKESLNSFGNNHSFLGDKVKPNIKNFYIKEDSNDLELQIKDSLKKISEQYSMDQYENNNSRFNYYCTPFLYRNYNKNNLNFVNNNNETNTINNNLYK